MASRIQLIATAVAIGILGGCIDAPVHVGSQTSAIVNGKEDHGHQAVGEVKATIEGQEFLCTATLVGTHTVITSAHCISTLEKPYKLATEVVFFPGGATTGNPYKATSFAMHPDYDGGNKSDLAVIRLGHAVRDVVPMRVALSSPKLGEEVQIVGFGKTSESDEASAGIKRVAHNQVDEIKTQVVTYVGATGSEGNTCQGDSGAPVLATRNGKEELIGIHSTGTCGKPWAGLPPHGSAMRADVFRGWILQESQGNLYDTTGSSAGSLPPAIQFVAPASDATVQPSFTVELSVADTVGVSLVELFLDGEKMAEATEDPFTFEAKNLSQGVHTLEAVAHSTSGLSNSTALSITVQLTPPEQPSESKGIYGDACSTPDDCESGLCAQDTVTGQKFCTDSCDTNANTCPTGSVCQLTSSLAVCGPLHDDGSHELVLGENVVGGCSVASQSSEAPWSLLMLLALGAVLRRRFRG